MSRLKSKYLICFTIFLFLGEFVYGQHFNWAKHTGSTAWDEGTAIAVDNLGNVYTTGFFEGTVDFDPGPAVFDLTSVEEDDAFVSKLNPEGELIWAIQFGDSSFVESNAISTDASGNAYITGSFLGQVDFDPGTDTFNLISSSWDRDTYILKLDANGDFVWAKQISGVAPTLMSTPAPNDAYAIAVDKVNNVYITGYFDGTVDFDPDPLDTFLLDVVQQSDIFVSKLDSNGNFVWAKQFGGTQGGVGYAIAIDESGGVYSTGTIGPTATVDFDPGVDTFYLTAPDPFLPEIYVSKLDSAGNFAWANAMGIGEGSAIAVNANGDVYTSGWYPSGVPSVINKTNSSGNVLWTKELGAINGKSIAVDNNGNVYTTGACFSGAHDFDPGLDTFYLSAGINDAFVSKLDASGDFLWAGLLEATNQITTNALAIDQDDNVYVTGFFDQTADFDPATTAFNLSSNGSYDVFVSKLSPVYSGFGEKGSDLNVNIFPNPTDGVITIEFDEKQENLSLVLKNMLGQTVEESVISNGNQTTIVITEPAGIYVLEISDQNGQKYVARIIRR